MYGGYINIININTVIYIIYNTGTSTPVYSYGNTGNENYSLIYLSLSLI